MTKNPEKSVASEHTIAMAPETARKLDAEIGARLRNYYESLMQEPVPDRIVDLLLQLEQKERADKPTAPDDAEKT